MSGQSWEILKLMSIIRITDIDDYGNLLNDDWQTTETSPNTCFKKMMSFARSIYKSKFGRATFAGYLIRFKFDLEKVNPSFVFYYN